MVMWLCFCGGGGGGVNIQPENSHLSVFCHLCGGVVVWCCLRCVYVEQRCSAESVVSRPFRKHPAQELMSSFRANLSTFRRSAI